jgi:hypothetical protein
VGVSLGLAELGVSEDLLNDANADALLEQESGGSVALIVITHNRHTCAMTLLGNGVDVAVIALWLGHQDIRTTQQIYLHADMTLKRRALAATSELGATGKIRRYQAPDSLMSFLEQL